jgi:hypothetical protein
MVVMATTYNSIDNIWNNGMEGRKVNYVYVVIVCFQGEFDGFVSQINYERPLWNTGAPKTWKKKSSAKKCADTIMSWGNIVNCKVVEINY